MQKLAIAVLLAASCVRASAQASFISNAEYLFAQGRQHDAMKTVALRLRDPRTGEDEKADLANCFAWMNFKQEHSDLVGAANYAAYALSLRHPRDESFLHDVRVFDYLTRTNRGDVTFGLPKNPNSPLVDVSTPENIQACSRSRVDFIDALLRERARDWEEWRTLWQDALALDEGTAAFETLTKHTTADPAAVMASVLPRLRAGNFKDAHDRLRKLLPTKGDVLNTPPPGDVLYIELLIDIATDEPIAATTEFEELEAVDRARALVLESAGMENFTHPARPPSIDVKISFLLMVMQTEQLFASEVYNGLFANASEPDRRRLILAAERFHNFDIAQVRDDFRTQLAALDRRTAEQFYEFEQRARTTDDRIQTEIAALRDEREKDYKETREQIRRLFHGLDLQRHTLDHIAYDITALRAKQDEAAISRRLSETRVAQQLDDLGRQLALDRQNNSKELAGVADAITKVEHWRLETDHGKVVRLVVEIAAHVMAHVVKALSTRIVMEMAPAILILVE